MTDRDKTKRQLRAFKKYFGDTPREIDMWGEPIFPDSFEKLDKLANEYKAWYKSEQNPTIDNVPDKLRMVYQIHHNASGELFQRAQLLSKMTDISIGDALKQGLDIRSITIPVDAVNGAMIYSSTIYRGKTQVDTGTFFERRIESVINEIGEDITIIPGRDHSGKSYDKDILISDDYNPSLPLFPLTTPENPFAS